MRRWLCFVLLAIMIVIGVLFRSGASLAKLVKGETPNQYGYTSQYVPGEILAKIRVASLIVTFSESRIQGQMKEATKGLSTKSDLWWLEAHVRLNVHFHTTQTLSVCKFSYPQA